MEKEFKAIYGQAMSIVTHKPSQYAKNITLRYPMKSTFKGDKIRICLDNFTGKEGVVFDSITIGRVISGRDLDPTSIVDITFALALYECWNCIKFTISSSRDTPDTLSLKLSISSNSLL